MATQTQQSPARGAKSLDANPFYRAAFDHALSMLAYGRGVVDGQPSPLFTGVVDAGKRIPITSFVIPPPGIRFADYNWCGNNMSHDLPLLEVIDRLHELTGDERFRGVVDDALAFYGKHCPYPGTGLFPWGEHAQWSFSDKRMLPCSFTDGLAHLLQFNYAVHDHLHHAPRWFWDRLYRHAPQAVVRFAHGLDRHIVNRDTFEHNRHAPLTESTWDEEGRRTGKGKDFARHAGFFIFDCLFAYARSGDRSLLEWSQRKLKYQVSRILPDGIVAGCMRTPEATKEGQHDSFALTLAEAAELLPEGSAERREFASVAEGLFDARRRSAPKSFDGMDPEELWVDGYFRRTRAPLINPGLFALCYQRTKLNWYADALVGCAREVAKLLTPPPAIPILARTYNRQVDLLLTAHVVSGDAALLSAAERAAKWAIDDLARNGFLLGASRMIFVHNRANGEYHLHPRVEPSTPGMVFSVACVANLARTLLRLALVQEKQPDVIGPDPYLR